MRAVEGDVFTQAVAQVSVAADRGDTLPILTGVRMEIEGDKITLLATDGTTVAGTVHGEPMFVREMPAGVLVASEPSDDEDGWTEKRTKTLEQIKDVLQDSR